MTNSQLAGRLRGIAAQKPTDIWRELHALAMELEIGPAITLPRPAPVELVDDPDPEPLEVTPETIADLCEPEVDGDMEAIVRATQPLARRPGLLASILIWRRS